jgi:hypothetical protein
VGAGSGGGGEVTGGRFGFASAPLPASNTRHAVASSSASNSDAGRVRSIWGGFAGGGTARPLSAYARDRTSPAWLRSNKRPQERDTQRAFSVASWACSAEFLASQVLGLSSG